MNYYNPIVNNLEQYVVKQGDSLYMIAKKYGVEVDDLKNVNHLVSNMIYPNQILFIPRKKHSSHMTKYDDSISGLIEKYNYTLNDISNLKVMPNQTLPNRHEVTHTCKYGESIEDILAKYQISPLALLKYNEDKLITPGKEIIIEK